MAVSTKFLNLNSHIPYPGILPESSNQTRVQIFTRVGVGKNKSPAIVVFLEMALNANFPTLFSILVYLGVIHYMVLVFGFFGKF